MLISIPRPNGVWLRIWLILAYIIMMILAAEFVSPKVIAWFGSNSLLNWLYGIIYTVALMIVLLILWNRFKRPDCKCWDDMDPDCSGEPTMVTKLTGKQEAGAKEDYP